MHTSLVNHNQSFLSLAKAPVNPYLNIENMHWRTNVKIVLEIIDMRNDIREFKLL